MLKKKKWPGEPLVTNLRGYGEGLKVLTRKLSDTLDDDDREMLVQIIGETEDLASKLEHRTANNQK